MEHSSSFSLSPYIICTQQCPHKVFPNESVDHILVNLVEDANLMSKLKSVASSNMTQLQELAVPTVASLLPKPEWQSKKVVTLPHCQIPDDWLEKFWNWAQPYDLSHFATYFLFPLMDLTSPDYLKSLNPPFSWYMKIVISNLCCQLDHKPLINALGLTRVYLALLMAVS